MSDGIPWVLADDLSGALEAGAAWRAQGWRVTVALTEAGAGPPQPAGKVVRLVSTESRNLPAERAFAAVRNALSRCKRSRGVLRYKKIDSTLRGPIAAEVRALLETLSPSLVVITPANPAMRRIVIDGELLVDGRPVAETDFAHDPVWPVPHGSVSRLLREERVAGVQEVRAASRLGVEGLLDAIRAAIGLGNRVLVADAETLPDLTVLVKVVRRLVPQAVFVGSGAMAAILAERCEPGAPIPVVQREGGVLFVLGSKHAITRTQLAGLVTQRRVAVVPLSPESSESSGREAARILSHEPFAVLVVDDNVNAPSLAVSEAIRAAVRSVISQVAVRAIFATGGETARVVCDVLAGSELEIVGELEPGVVRSIVQCPSGIVTLVVKPGGFGTPETLVSVAAALETR